MHNNEEEVQLMNMLLTLSYELPEWAGVLVWCGVVFVCDPIERARTASEANEWKFRSAPR